MAGTARCNSFREVYREPSCAWRARAKLALGCSADEASFISSEVRREPGSPSTSSSLDVTLGKSIPNLRPQFPYRVHRAQTSPSPVRLLSRDVSQAPPPQVVRLVSDSGPSHQALPTLLPAAPTSPYLPKKAPTVMLPTRLLNLLPGNRHPHTGLSASARPVFQQATQAHTGAGEGRHHGHQADLFPWAGIRTHRKTMVEQGASC